MSDYLCKSCEHYVVCEHVYPLIRTCHQYLKIVRCNDCWKNGEGLCSYKLKDVPGKDFCGDGERRTE